MVLLLLVVFLFVCAAMPGRRGMGGGSNFRNTAVQIDVGDARAFPTDVALQSDPPSELVRQHLEERRGVKLPADYSSKMSQKKLNVQPNAFLEALHPWRPGARPGAAAAAEPLPWAEQKVRVGRWTTNTGSVSVSLFFLFFMCACVVGLARPPARAR